MSLLRRKPSKPMKISEAADLLGCGRDTMKAIAKREGFRMWKNNPSFNSPWLVYEADVIAYRQRREGANN